MNKSKLIPEAAVHKIGEHGAVSFSTPTGRVCVECGKKVADIAPTPRGKYYIEFEVHLDDHTEEEVVSFSNEFVELCKKYNCYPPKAGVIKNPTYDSFGNLWQ